MIRRKTSALTGDAEAKLVWILCKETVKKGALADARGARQDEGPLHAE